jgi:transposase
MAVPGVGPVTAVPFVAAVDRVERFPNAARVASYLGLIPGEPTTGFRTRRTHLTRAGAPQVRWAARTSGVIVISPAARGPDGVLGQTNRGAPRTTRRHHRARAKARARVVRAVEASHDIRSVEERAPGRLICKNGSRSH